MKKFFTLENTVCLLLFCVIANGLYLTFKFGLFAVISILLFAGILVLAGALKTMDASRRIKICYRGGVLLGTFSLSLIVSIAYHVFLFITSSQREYATVIWSMVVCIIYSTILFWVGIIYVYLTCSQLGIKWRVIGILCGLIPVVNLVVLSKIINKALGEAEFELIRQARNKEREDKQVCKTKYPLLLIHGVFFRDTKFFNYWGRIPEELENNGATVFYGEHQSALSVKDSAEEIALRIKQIVDSTGCEKVNIIAHSKGGLDCRYAIANLGIGKYVASLTTVNTPHRGCLFADSLLGVAPKKLKDDVANAYNTALVKFGDTSPDFISAVSDLTSSACSKIAEDEHAFDGIYCQSIGSRLNNASGGTFPLNLSYHLVRAFDGDNDGLVGVESFSFGENFKLFTTCGKRGISHADVIDLTREDIIGFDVREEYVKIVSDLKSRGL